MRLSDAGLRLRPTKLIYPDHQLPPLPNEDTPRDRSNRLLGGFDGDDCRVERFNHALFACVAKCGKKLCRMRAVPPRKPRGYRSLPS
jgi:hypothetical protein